MKNLKKYIKVGVGAIIIKNGKTLLTKRKGSHGADTYGSLGGHVEFGESLQEAVKREAMEELGIEIYNLKFVSCINMIAYDKHYVGITFSAQIKAGKPTIMEPDKIESLDWYDLDNLPKPLFHPVQVALELYKSDEHYREIRV